MINREGWQGAGDWNGPRDYVEAAKWYQLAADQDEASAQYILGARSFSVTTLTCKVNGSSTGNTFSELLAGCMRRCMDP